MDKKSFTVISAVILVVLWLPHVPTGIAVSRNDSIQTRVSANGRFLIRNFKDRKYLVNGFHNIYCKRGSLHGDSNLYCTNEGVIKGGAGLQCLDNKYSYVDRPLNIKALSCEPKPFSSKDFKRYAPAKESFSSKKYLKHLLFPVKKIFSISLPFSSSFKNTDYLIITRPMFLDSLSELITLKEQQGFKVKVVALENILEPKGIYYADYAIGDIQETIKNFLQKLSQENATIKYVLIVGTPRQFNYEDGSGPYNAQYTTSLSYPWEVPIRYIYPEEDWSDGSKGMGIPTDQYYASATSNWDKNNNKIYGEFENEEYSFKPDFYIGRVPVKTTEQLESFVEKIKKWVPPDDFTESMFSQAACWPEYISDTVQAYSYAHGLVCHYCPSDDCGDQAPFANIDKSHYLSSYSHGYYKQTTGAFKLTKESALDHNPIVFLHACQVGGLDYTDESLGQYLMGSPDGSTAFIGTTRSMPDIGFLFKDYIFFNNTPVIGDAFYNYKYQENSERLPRYDEITLFLMYQLYGDPSMVVIPKTKFGMSSVDKLDLDKSNYSFEISTSNKLNAEMNGEIRVANSNYYSKPIQIPVGEKSFNVNAVPSVSMCTGTVRSLWFIQFSDDTAAVVSKTIKGGIYPLLFNKYSISCNPWPVTDDQGYASVSVKTSEVYSSQKVTVDVFAERGGFGAGSGPEKISSFAFEPVEKNIFSWQFKEYLPIQLYSPYADDGSTGYGFSSFVLKFYSDNKLIHECREYPANKSFSDYNKIQITPDMCEKHLIDSVEPETVLIFPSGKYIIIKNIMPENGKTLYRTFEMEEEGELYLGGGINLPPTGTNMLMMPKYDFVQITKVYNKDSKPMLDVEILCEFTCIPGSPECSK